MTVLDAHREPVDAAIVWGAPSGWQEDGARAGCRTADDGSCVLPIARVEGEVDLEVVHADYGTFEGTRWLSPSGIRVVLAPGATVRGKVVGDVAVAGLTVALLRPGGTSVAMPRARTEDGGGFRLDGVAPGMYRVRVSGSEQGGVSREFVVAGGDDLDIGTIEVRPEGELRVRIVAGERSCLRGRVRVVGTQVAARSDPAGEVRLGGLLPGEHRITGSCFEPFAADTGTVAVAVTRGVQEVTLPIGDLVWREGTVRGDDVLERLDGIRVAFRAGHHAGSVSTDSEGSVRFAVPDGVEFCGVRVDDPRVVSAEVDCLAPQEFELEARARGVPIRVRVVDGSGAPVAGAEVFEVGADGSRRPVGVVGSGGALSIEEGDPGRVRAICAIFAQVETCADVLDSRSIDLELPCSGPREVHGRIMSVGDPRDARVWVEATAAPGPPLAETRADAEGAFEIAAPGCGDALLHVELLSGGRGQHLLSKEVRGSEELVVEVRAPGIVRVHLGCDETRAAPIRVELVRAGGFFPERVVWRRAGQGTAEFRGVPSGAYRLRATGHAEATFELESGETRSLTLSCAS